MRRCPLWTMGGPVTVPALLEALLAGPPADSGLTSPIPEGTRLLGWRNQDGVAVGGPVPDLRGAGWAWI